MQRSIVIAAIVSLSGAAYAQTPPAGYVAPVPPPMVVVAQPPVMKSDLGGGFIEYLFGNSQRRAAALDSAAVAGTMPRRARRAGYVRRPGGLSGRASRGCCPTAWTRAISARKWITAATKMPGTIVIDTPNHFLYLVEPHGKAIRYGIGVGRPGFTWSGEHTISAKKEWPDWMPPDRNAGAPAVPAALHGGRPGQPARRARASISARRSTASTARTSRGRSVTTCRQAASACVTPTSSTSTTASRSAPPSSCSNSLLPADGRARRCALSAAPEIRPRGRIRIRARADR